MSTPLLGTMHYYSSKRVARNCGPLTNKSCSHLSAGSTHVRNIPLASEELHINCIPTCIIFGPKCAFLNNLNKTVKIYYIIMLCWPENYIEPTSIAALLVLAD